MKFSERKYKSWNLAFTMGICIGVWATLGYLVITDILFWY